ncbi:hybrid sensor histidine kinase/response regulator [Rodentibacter pneumotropicus]|uniref:histidine kinase n=1 Tax=Rodentibacter pneumotropicus TaxID=758 RepID=A0AAW5LAH2_9PAST|nr:ATP-binding protein [Rodentibacter pneumotropicus]MCQ9120787.1 response regulator [Rodentibacter pneumotropicus]OOF69224.1 hybrid sensor histidine kinase/response regulator [Rodentibacter pneumotropicus]
MKNWITSTKIYSVRFRLMLFLITVISLIIAISMTAIIGLNNTYNSLSNLRDRSLNQMFSSMTLGVKTAQISTYAKRLTQTTSALEYQGESKSLTHHAEELQNLLKQAKQSTAEPNEIFTQVIHHIDLLEKSVQDLLLQTHERHVLHTTMISQLNQELLYIRHIKRLEKRVVSADAEHQFPQNFLIQLDRVEKLIEDATKSRFSVSVFTGIQANFLFFPPVHQFPDINEELMKLQQQFPTMIDNAKILEKVNLRIQFLTFKIDALVQQINQHYTQLVKDKVENANTNSEQVQQHLFTLTLFILLFSLFTIFLIIIWAKYIYSLIGKRLYSITNALKCLSQGNKNVTVPQQHSHDEIGDLARTFDVFYQNVIELERTDSLLKEKNELVEQTFLAMRDGLVIFDKELNLISHNAQFKILLQPFFTEYKQHSLYSLASYFDSRQTKVMGSNQSINLTLLTEVRQAQDFLEIQYEKYILEWRVSPLKDGFVIFLIDRTQRKKWENEIIHNQKMRAIGHLTGGIAHDFNNFLAVIIGNLDLINPAHLDERQAKRLQRALKAAENSATLTQRLLAYARKQPLHPISLNINRLVLEFNDLIKHSIPTNIKVRLDLGENLPPVYIDKNQLETALLNLIVNAKDALNDQGTITIQTTALNVTRTYRQEHMVQLSVIDDGCGMDEETINHVFEPFFTTKQNGRGSGLGLSMVYGFIRQSKGRVKIDSFPAQGTAIHLQLPITKNMNTTIPTPKNFSKNEVRYKILIVEDKTSLRETLGEQLHVLGYMPILCESAEQAIEQLEQGEKIDYLLSDIMLSDKLSGIDLAKWVQTNFPAIKILLITGHTAQLENAEQFPVLIKPFTLQSLQQKLLCL